MEANRILLWKGVGGWLHSQGLKILKKENVQGDDEESLEPMKKEESSQIEIIEGEPIEKEQMEEEPRMDEFEQVETSEEEMNRNESESVEASEESFIEGEMEPMVEKEDEPTITKDKRKKKRKVIALSIAGTFLILLLGVYIFANYMLNRINYEKDSDVVRAPSDLTVNAQSVVKVEEKKEEEFIDTKKQNIFNILLIGEECDDTEERGRSDANIILSINKKKKTIKLVSFLRDSFVEIPGYLDNKLNEAYRKGGGPLLTETIEKNFNIKIDGYVRVNYEKFETIIDQLGGVEIKLSKEEAKYLNNTNYISKRKYRNVKEGKQVLNGNQALGYCRIRKLQTIDGTSSDWGRTSRQRRVLMQIYEKYKTKNAVELVTIMNDLLPLATTNMKKSELVYLLRLVLSLGIDEVKTIAIPVNNGYHNQSEIPGRLVTDVLVLDFEINNKEIKDFINGEGKYSGDSPSMAPSETPNGKGEAIPTASPKPNGKGKAAPTTSPKPNGKGKAAPTASPKPNGKGKSTPTASPKPNGKGKSTPTASPKANGKEKAASTTSPKETATPGYRYRY